MSYLVIQTESKRRGMNKKGKIAIISIDGKK